MAGESWAAGLSRSNRNGRNGEKKNLTVETVWARIVGAILEETYGRPG